MNRIGAPIDAILRKNQAGFGTGRSCIQQTHILRLIMDGANSPKIPLFITFVDFKKTLVSIDRAIMFAILRHYADMLAPFLFIIILTHKENNQENSGRAVRSTTRSTYFKVNVLAFADDIALLEKDSVQDQRQLDSLQTESGKIGLEINDIKIGLFQVECVSILWHGSKTWILTEAVTEKLDIFARTC